MAEEVEEPTHLLCSITLALLRDPVFVPQSGNTYERDALVRTHPSAAVHAHPYEARRRVMMVTGRLAAHRSATGPQLEVEGTPSRTWRWRALRCTPTGTSGERCVAVTAARMLASFAPCHRPEEGCGWLVRDRYKPFSTCIPTICQRGGSHGRCQCPLPRRTLQLQPSAAYGGCFTQHNPRPPPSHGDASG